MEKDSIAKQIRELRMEKSWSQSLLAKAAGLSLRTIQRIETNGKAAPETLLAVAGAFDIDVEKLTGKIIESEGALQSESLLGIHISQRSLLIRFKSWFGKKLIQGRKLMASLGLLMIFIPLLFIGTNIIKYTLGFEGFPNLFDVFKLDESLGNLYNNLSPFLFFSGLILGTLLNLIPFLDISMSIGKENKIQVAYSGGWENTIVWLTASLSFGIMLLYALAENGIVMFGL
ncbi:MAG: helix-turn-helix transcriptional regulator [Balneolaceae bacterium]